MMDDQQLRQQIPRPECAAMAAFETREEIADGASEAVPPLDLMSGAGASSRLSAANPRSTSDFALTPPLALDRFPEDITSHLVSTIGLVSPQSTLLNLCLCSKGMYDMFSPYLYRELTLSIWNVRKVFSGLLWDIEASLSDSPEYNDPTNGAFPDSEEGRYQSAKAREDELWEGLCWVKWCFGPGKDDDPPYPMSEAERRRRFPLDEGDRESMDNASMFDWRLTKEERKAKDPLRWKTRDERQRELVDAGVGAGSAGTYSGKKMVVSKNGRGTVRIPLDPLTSHRRKVTLLNHVEHLTINDLEAATTLASYLDIKPTTIFPNDMQPNQECPHTHPPQRVFLALRSITLGADLLRSKALDEGYYPHRAEVERHPSRSAEKQRQTIHALACGLKPGAGVACARWESKALPSPTADHIWRSNLETLLHRWKVHTFTWHVDLDDGKSPRRSLADWAHGTTARRSNTVDLDTIPGVDGIGSQSSVIGCLKDIKHLGLRVFYHGICSCDVGCSRNHIDHASSSTSGIGGRMSGGSGSNDACLAELGIAATLIDDMRWGDPPILTGSSSNELPAYTASPARLEAGSEDGDGVADRSMELVGLPCLVGIGYEGIRQAAINNMRRSGFGEVEVRAAQERWESRKVWVEKGFKIMGDVAKADACEGCGCR
ncbi:hypothetical protein IAT40_004290 [Kwoniella sp. CBS 6097]